MKNFESKILEDWQNDCHTHNAYLNFRGSMKILDDLAVLGLHLVLF